MSLEFIGKPAPSLNDELIQSVRRTIANESGYLIVREAGPELGLKFPNYAPDDTEDITAILQPNEVYVAFHTGTRTLRNEFLRCIHEALASTGVSCNLQED